MTPEVEAAVAKIKEREKPLLNATWLGIVFGLTCWIAARAPTMVTNATVPIINQKLEKFNVGHVVVLGPVVLLMILIRMRYLADDLRLSRIKFAKTHDSAMGEILRSRWWLSWFVFPAVLEAIIVLQFFQETYPSTENSSFQWWRFLVDTGCCWERQIRYRFGVADADQAFMPYIYAPLQAWLYLILVGLCFYLAVCIFRCFTYGEESGKTYTTSEI